MEIQERDRTWFCEEIQRCRSSLYRLALSITANPEDAAEAAAEAVCRAYEKFPQLRDRKNFSRGFSRSPGMRPMLSAVTGAGWCPWNI